MHDPKVMAKFGCTNERLREICTASDVPMLGENPTDAETKAYNHSCKNREIRKRWEFEMWARTQDGIRNSIINSKPIQAVDIAWDAPPIQKETLPLLLWAQGKIKIQSLWDSLVAAGDTNLAQKFISKDPTTGTLGVNIPRIYGMSINLVRSYVTRRHAALDALWSNLWPLLKYSPRGTDSVSQLRADATTQRVDIISDAYNYRHMLSQCRRDMLLYGSSVLFPRSAWDRQTSWRFKKTNTGEQGDEIESYVTREGVDFVNPHPSRIFYDMSAPLPNINTDTGPRWIGYWDILRYEELLSHSYFNNEDIAVNEGWIQLASQFAQFFGFYFDPTVLEWPPLDAIANNPAAANDRTIRTGRYSSTMKDKGVLLTQLFKRLNPKVEGIGDYDADVWVRFVTGGVGTIVAAEFLPGKPACYGGINCNDNRVANESMAMELLGFQDQLSNIVSQMIAQLRSSFTQLWLLDRDSLDENIRKNIEDNAGNKDWWIDPHVLIYSASKLRDLGVQDPSQAFKIIQPQIQVTIDSSLRAIGQLLSLADRLINTSPNELGQPNPREVSARETQEISTTVQSIYSFISQGPREQVASFKELVYDAMICNASPTFRVPVIRRYTPKTIKMAGFEVPDDIPEKDAAEDDVLPSNTPIMGNLHNLVYDYYFDSRDGAERPLNTQGAQVLTQMMQMLLQIPAVAQKMGLDRIFELCNTIIRMSGAPFDLNLELNDGENSTIPTQQPASPQQGAPGGPSPQGVPPQGQPGQVPPQLMQAIQMLQGQLGRQDGVLQVVLQALQQAGINVPTPAGTQAGGLPSQAPTGAPPAPGPSTIQQGTAQHLLAS